MGKALYHFNLDDVILLQWRETMAIITIVILMISLGLLGYLFYMLFREES